ncbi:hypothetical protein COT64_00500 [Candidatus Shapirobacteria bacterium CG09_land_8_20_14_0_10_39_12]|uniref:Uncharacterized protein n=1 Tax=Candidatus Shapirobacteria bacterium CG09_land_8_20_14_0_10_39_12 TaxID=1974885 RepID=A0A2H0WSF4_9BACT|nr:MAG: hypothetical protein COT64_00500 [Candidatus Shapirobacteria bacterium CG09_land_8_20_14_0_10_39_12]
MTLDWCRQFPGLNQLLEKIFPLVHIMLTAGTAEKQNLILGKRELRKRPKLLMRNILKKG